MACPVCFSPTDPTATASLNLGIFVLLGVTAVVLAGFIRFIVSLGRLAGREGPPYENGGHVGRAFTARQEHL